MFQSNNPLIIAHRGATHYAPENSYEAVQKAIDLGMDAVEVDIRVTSDRHLVCFHDENIMRMTGLNRKVSSISSRELRNIRLFSDKSGDNMFPLGKVLFLEDMLDLAKGKILLNIELKGPHWKTEFLETKVLTPIKKRGMEKQILISSFFPLPLKRIQRMTASVKTGLLLHPTNYKLAPGWSSKWLDLHSIHPPYQLVTNKRMTKWREFGYSIYVWTVNDQILYEKLIDQGVNGIITDIPEELLSFIGEKDE